MLEVWFWGGLMVTAGTVVVLAFGFIAAVLVETYGKHNVSVKTIVAWNEILGVFVLTKQNHKGQALLVQQATHEQVMAMLDHHSTLKNPIELEISRDAEIELKQWQPTENRFSYE